MTTETEPQDVVNDDGTVTVLVGEKGTILIITFVPENAENPISVSPIEVTACAEAGNEAFLT